MMLKRQQKTCLRNPHVYNIWAVEQDHGRPQSANESVDDDKSKQETLVVARTQPYGNIHNDAVTSAVHTTE